MSLLVESLPFLHFGSSDFGVVRGILRVESNFADLSINNEEEVEILLDEIDGSKEGVPNDLCLVGRFITQQIVNFTRMKNTQTSVWRPMRGVSIKPIGEGRFLFQFYHMLDVYDLAHGYFTERVGSQLGDFIGKFLEYDNSNRGASWMTFMRIRVEVNTDIHLKCWKKVGHKAGGSFLVHNYEKLNSFCFICGLLDHTENYCKVRFASPDVVPKREWGIFLRAPDHRGKMVGPLSGINSILTNPIFEEDNRVKVLELGDCKGDEERKRKRGKMIMGDSYGNNSLELVAMNTDDNTVDSDTTLVMAGLVSGAYREL
ncbi:hypothetical protein ACS0TY_013771 [Phlomoides rotata]